MSTSLLTKVESSMKNIYAKSNHRNTNRPFDLVIRNSFTKREPVGEIIEACEITSKGERGSEFTPSRTAEEEQAKTGR